MQRIIEPEILDELPPESPRAIRSRSDLRRINWLMGNVPLLAGIVRQRLPAQPRTIVELGSGDGLTMLALARRVARFWKEPVSLQMLDAQPVIAPGTLAAFRELGWSAEIVKADVRSWMARMEPTDLVVANLFLHHFSESDLRDFFGTFSAAAGAFVSCDPRRWRRALLSTRLLWAIGCNDVTRHDALVSVRAGFRERELSALWPSGSDFTVWEGPGGYASHLFCAVRRRLAQD